MSPKYFSYICFFFFLNVSPCRWLALMSACLARTEKVLLRCTLLPAGGTIVFWRDCLALVQRSSRINGEGPHFTTLPRMGSWRFDTKVFTFTPFAAVISFWICFHVTLQCCRILLANRADPSDQDIDGFTAADLSEYNGHYECSRYLRAMETNVSSLCFDFPVYLAAYIWGGAVNSKHLEGLMILGESYSSLVTWCSVPGQPCPFLLHSCLDGFSV